MAGDSSTRRILRERLAATAETDRFAVISCFEEGPASTRELADKSGIEIAKIRYLIRRWLSAGIVERVDGESPTASGASTYRLCPAGLRITDTEAAELPDSRLNQARGRSLGLTLRQAMALAAEGRYGEGESHSAFRLPITADLEAQQAGIRLIESTVDSIEAICRRARRRLRTRGPAPTVATSACIAYFRKPRVSHAEIDQIDLGELAPRGKGPRNIKVVGAWESPLVFEIEYLLLTRPYTVGELVTELGVGESSVRRAVAALQGTGAIAVHEERETRGTRELRLVGDPLAKVRAATPGSKRGEDRKEYEQWLVRNVAREMLAAAREGYLGGPRCAFAWLPMDLDDATDAAVGKEIDALGYAMIDLRADCVRRDSWRAGDAEVTSCALFYFRHD